MYKFQIWQLKDVGTFKTLRTDLDAMITAGKVSGVMTAMIQDVVYANRESFCPENFR